MSVRIGYKASAEQFGRRQLLEFSLAAETAGMEIVAVSDHFQPWRHNGGHAPAAMPWLAALGQASRDAVLGTSVLTPTLRYHPSIVAQAFGTLASLSPGRYFLGIGCGEAINETPATGQQFPGRIDTLPRLAESVDDVSLQHIAQILAWIAGPRGVSTDQPAEELGADRPRIMRELDAAERTGVIRRGDDGAVVLTEHGWDVAGDGV